MKGKGNDPGFDISGKFDSADFSGPEESIYIIRIIEEYVPGNYCSGWDINYVGSLDKSSLKPGKEIRVVRNVLPSGGIHDMVFAEKYVASGDVTTPEKRKEIEKKYTHSYGWAVDPCFWDNTLGIYRPSFVAFEE